MTYRCCPTPGAEKREVIVKDGNTRFDGNLVYDLTAKVNGEIYEKLCFYCTNQPIDCHFLVRMSKGGEEDCNFFRDRVVGIAHSKEEIAEKIYKTVLKYARNRVDSEAQIIDETSMGGEKMSKLESESSA